MGIGNLNKECETTFGSSATIVAKTVTHSKFQSYSLKLQQIIYKNGLHKYYVYTIAQIKLYFCGIASPQCEIHWLYVNKELLTAQPQLWLKEWFTQKSSPTAWWCNNYASNKYQVYIMTHIKLHLCRIASPEGGVHWLLLKFVCLTIKFAVVWLRYFGRRPPKFWARCLIPGFPVHILTFPHRDKMCLITDRTICWLQNFFK